MGNGTYVVIACAEPECLFSLLSSAHRLRRAHPQELSLLPGNSGGFDKLGLGPSTRVASKSRERVRGEEGDFRLSKLANYLAVGVTPREYGRVVGASSQLVPRRRSQGCSIPGLRRVQRLSRAGMKLRVVSGVDAPCGWWGASAWKWMLCGHALLASRSRGPSVVQRCGLRFSGPCALLLTWCLFKATGTLLNAQLHAEEVLRLCEHT